MKARNGGKGMTDEQVERYGLRDFLFALVTLTYTVGLSTVISQGICSLPKGFALVVLVQIANASHLRG